MSSDPNSFLSQLRAALLSYANLTGVTLKQAGRRAAFSIDDDPCGDVGNLVYKVMLNLNLSNTALLRHISENFRCDTLGLMIHYTNNRIQEIRDIDQSCEPGGVVYIQNTIEGIVLQEPHWTGIFNQLGAALPEPKLPGGRRRVSLPRSGRTPRAVKATPQPAPVAKLRPLGTELDTHVAD